MSVQVRTSAIPVTLVASLELEQCRAVPGLERSLDTEGQDLQNLAAARDAAVVSARKIVARLLLVGGVDDELQFEIADDYDTVLLVVPFKSVLAH